MRRRKKRTTRWKLEICEKKDWSGNTEQKNIFTPDRRTGENLLFII